jgi:hypothetical protein
MSTVTEIKQAVSKLPQRKKLALVQWLHAQVDDRLTDEEMMAIAAEGARALDKREAAYAKRKHAVRSGKLISAWPPKCGRL